MKTKNYGDVIRDKLDNDPKLARRVRIEEAKAAIAQLVYSSRSSAGMTQEQLAKLAELPVSTIRKIEDSDYEYQDLELLEKIANALGWELNAQSGHK
jgi:ribosome-binding protein aMBF1 (putative translation factor)